MAQRDGVERRDRPERARQRLAGGQRGIVDQHGHHAGRRRAAPPRSPCGRRPPPRAAARGAGPRSSAIVTHCGPITATITSAARTRSSMSRCQSVPGLQVARVEEDAVGAEPGLERVGDLPRRRRAVRAAVADEHGRPGLCGRAAAAACRCPERSLSDPPVSSPGSVCANAKSAAHAVRVRERRLTANDERVDRGSRTHVRSTRANQDRYPGPVSRRETTRGKLPRLRNTSRRGAPRPFASGDARPAQHPTAPR